MIATDPEAPARIAFLGAGVMASALAVTGSDTASHHVSVIGSPLDDPIVDAVRRDRHHPTLDVVLPDSIEFLAEHEQADAVLREADIVILGVSSPGMGWALDRLQRAEARPAYLALVTKGLVSGEDSDDAPLTYADALPADLTREPGRLIGIGGPCIARELALRLPTRVTFASRDRDAARYLRDRLQTDYYRVAVSSDPVGVEACAALKNFLCIGISAVLDRYDVGDGKAKNPVAALFNQGVHELHRLSRWLRGGPTHDTIGFDPAFDLAGLGDLHVTVGGGRNSRLGRQLGTGRRLSDILDGPMLGVTVEGVDTGRVLSPGFRAACERGQLDPADFPLTLAILDCIDDDLAFEFDYRRLPA